jgi:hypothetical protein
MHRGMGLASWQPNMLPAARNMSVRSFAFRVSIR